MVYCGKPSKACAECRLRRTKCDTLKPSCSQCIRAGRICQGYRDPQDMMFRDEAQVLSTKRQRLANTKKAHHAVSASRPKELASSLVCTSSEAANTQLYFTNSSPVSLLTLDLGSSAEEQATCFFWRNYILEEHKFHNGNFQYLSDLYACEDIGQPLAETVACLGLVGLSNFWKASNILRTAQAKYHSALKLVSSRLGNVEEAKSNQTLVSVMLLGLYEVMICRQFSWCKLIVGYRRILAVVLNRCSLGRSISQEPRLC